MSQLQNYLKSSSPLSRLQNVNKFPLKEIHNSIDLKMSILRDSPKNYISHRTSLPKNRLPSQLNFSSSAEYSQIKASSIIYKIPEVSPPQINFEVTDRLRHKINQIKMDIVDKLPSIKSSQFSTNKLQSIFSRRTVLKDLQMWLQQKLKYPPLTLEDSIEYKNMIMGVGMSEVIRLIRTRCSEEADLINQIWELTWSICREIILHLSKRAHKCQKILQEESSFFRIGCETKIKDTEAQIKQFKQQNVELKQRCDKLSSSMAGLKKKNKQLKITKLHLQSNYDNLKQEFEVVFKENLLMHLQMAPNDQARRQWVKRKYRMFMNSQKDNDAIFREFLQHFLKENSIQFDQEELSQIQLTSDINKIKQQQNKRIFQIEQELQEKFKTIEKGTQTLVTEKRNVEIETDVRPTQDEGVQTQTLQVIDQQSNTEQIQQTQSKSKHAKKEKTAQKPSILVKKEGKQTKHKIKNKSTREQIGSTSDRVEMPDKQPKIDQQVKQMQDLNIEIVDSIPEKETHNINEACNQETNVESIDNKIKDCFVQDNDIVKQAEKQTIIQCLQSQPLLEAQNCRIVQNQNGSIARQIDYQASLRQKQEQIENLRSAFIQKQQAIYGEIEKLRSELQNKNKIIANLNRSVTTCQLSQVNQEPKEDVPVIQDLYQQKSVELPQDSKQTADMVALLRGKKYKELINIINYKQQATITETEGSVQRKSELRPRQNTKLSLNYQYQKKSLIPYQKFSSSIHSNYELDEQEDGIEEKELRDERSSQKEQRDSQHVSVKASRRSSFTNLLKNRNTIVEKTEKEEHNIDYRINHYPFHEICNSYYAQSYHTSQQTLNLNSKQLGLSDYNKRQLRDQYREVYRQIAEGQHGEKNEKQMRTVIEKSLASLFKELCKDITNAQKVGLNRIQEIKCNYSPLHLLMTNRFNMNFGVKKVASKHIKDLLVCLKGIKRYTEKYSIISYFMLNSASVTATNPISEAQETELLFFYVLLVTVVDGIASDRFIGKQESRTIAELASNYLTRDSEFIEYILNLPMELSLENCNNFVNYYKRLMRKYQSVCDRRRSEMEHIFVALAQHTKEFKSAISWSNFVNFVSVLSIKCEPKWHSDILKTMIEVMIEERSIESGLITYECFLKFVLKCPHFNTTSMKENIYALTSGDEADLSSAEQQQKYLSLCSSHPLLAQLAKHIFENEQLTVGNMEFWTRYIKLFILQHNVEDLLGSLLTGVLDPRSEAIIIKASQPVAQ